MCSIFYLFIYLFSFSGIIGQISVKLNFNFMQIFILLYKEVALALKINSLYSKKKLLSIHKNVKVLRYPNHLSAGIYYWYAIRIIYCYQTEIHIEQMFIYISVTEVTNFPSLVFDIYAN